MFDYSDAIDAFWDEKVRLSTVFKEKLYNHRKANRDRLISRVPETLGITITESCFKPQGSMAMQTIIQTRFSDEEYDIDDGIVFEKEDLKNDDGEYFSTEYIREKIKETLKDGRFCKQPKLCKNCVRVFYSEEDEEKHHVDFPIYRKYNNDNDDIVRELANEEEWIESDPTQVNTWFNDEIESRNKQKTGKGSQLRVLIQLLKRFVRSRQNWDMPNGMKLTMLATECQNTFYDRTDRAFRELLLNINSRLKISKTIRNLAHPDEPTITKTNNDTNVNNLKDKIEMAIDKLIALDASDCDIKQARSVWDWIFMGDGFFDDFDEKRTDSSEGIASSSSRYPVEHRGGGRFG
ncbi:MAG: hypothetical protein LBQ60_03255 [Bacteroidales bacterium]|jgi:hypothetical protein|nr:hypothetical protein [Bacteroidales bacterium]